MWLAIKEWDIWLAADDPLVEKTHLWIGVALDESQKSTHKCKEVYKLKALRQMRVWLFIYQWNNFQMCFWWKLQITDDLYICEFFLHVFKTRNICVCITNIFCLFLYVNFFLNLYMDWNIFVCALKMHLCIESYIYIQLPKYICESFFVHLFLSVCIYPLWDCSGSII